MDLILGRLLRNVGYQYRTEKACHCCNGSSLAGTSLRCSGQWIRVCAEAPPPSYRAILRPLCAIAPPRNARWLGSAPCTELRCYAGLFRGPKNGLEMRYRSGPVNSFLNLGPKSGLVVGSEKTDPELALQNHRKTGPAVRDKYCPILQAGRVAHGKRPFQGASD
jgi:hypothetical protein